MSFDSESYAFGSNVYGGRPTFGLTRRKKDDKQLLSLYEFAPEDLIEARKQRFERADVRKAINDLDLIEALVGSSAQATTKNMKLGEIESEGQIDPDDWDWDSWRAIEIKTLEGRQLRAVKSLVENVLAQENIDAQPILSGSEDSVLLSESAGVRLSLAFLGMNRLRNYDKLDEFATRTEQMSLEECYYWHSKVRSPTTPNGIKALRVLLTDHID